MLPNACFQAATANHQSVRSFSVTKSNPADQIRELTLRTQVAASRRATKLIQSVRRTLATVLSRDVRYLKLTVMINEIPRPQTLKNRDGRTISKTRCFRRDCSLILTKMRQALFSLKERGTRRHVQMLAGRAKHQIALLPLMRVLMQSGTLQKERRMSPTGPSFAMTTSLQNNQCQLLTSLHPCGNCETRREKLPSEPCFATKGKNR
jgi:hypothetical protein